MRRWVRKAAGRLHDDERGAEMVEYGMVLAVVAVVALAAAQAVGTAVTGVFEDIVSALTNI